MARVEYLLVENYRGASTRLRLEFDQSKPIVLLFGENGTGKTTIADAFDAIGNNSKGSLGERSSTSARQHLPTIGKTPTDVRMELKLGGNTWATSLKGENLTTTPQPSPKVRVLRRKHLQNLIEAEPAKRYEALRRFIDVDKVERSENALRDSANEVKAEFDAAVKLRVEADDQLQKVWLAEGKTGADALSWAKGVSVQNTLQLDKDASRLKEVQNIITTAEIVLAGYQLAINKSVDCGTEVQTIEKEVAQLPGVDAQQVISLADLLKQASDHLQIGTHSEECPVCKQEISIEKLKADIQSRLAALKQYEDLRTRRATALLLVQQTNHVVGTKRKELIECALSLLAVVNAADVDKVVASEIKALDYPNLTNTDVDGAACEEAVSLISDFIHIKQSLADDELIFTKKSGQINSVRELNERVQNSINTSELLEKLKIFLQQAYDVARLARIAFTQKILDEVAAECNRLYSQIHPSEPIAISKLELDQAKRASLNQAASFEGHLDVSPQAYFSESHLDTLGFCFWLAIAKLESPNKDTVIVLDDVFTSVDAPHINRIAQLITDESQNFSHVIITTHQRLWRDIYRNSHGPGKLTQIVELQGWSLAKGISNYQTKLAVVELSDAIKLMPFDRQVAASKAGVLLEAILDYLALQYRSRVPRTSDNSYTLGELLDGTTSVFKVLEIQRPILDDGGNFFVPPQYVKSDAKAILTALKTCVFVRNQVGAHYNITGSAISDADVSTFAGLAVQLADALSCTRCGQIPSKKNMTHFQCSCKEPAEMRMFPLQA